MTTDKIADVVDPIADRAVLVTGANRGLGRALVEEALRRGARRVYAGTRGALDRMDARVTPVRLDVTDAAQIRAAADQIESLDLLVNNAGIALADDLSERTVLEQHLSVNLFGTYAVTTAFLPKLRGSRGAIVNVLSLASLATVPVTPAYAVSKAAAFSLSQSLRALLADEGVTVHVALPGPVDTDMIRGWDIPKTPAQAVARAIFDGVRDGEEDIFPDPMSATVAQSWRDGAVKQLERQNAAAVRAVAAQN